MKPIALPIAIAALAGGCATPVAAPDEPKSVSDMKLAALAMHEECAQLAAGDRLEYSFSSDAPVNFNIHYHEGSAIVEPLTRERVTEDAGVFAPVIAQHYCLMWEAGPEPAKLDYRIRLRRAQ